MKRALLIDADILVYQAATVCEVDIKWDDEIHTLHSDEDEAKAVLDQRVATLKAQLEADYIVMCLTTSGRNFRKDVYPLYKANRKEVRKPLCFAALRAYCHETYPTVERDGLEGDDCMGVLATKVGPIYKGLPVSLEKIVVSLDKDMKTIPGKHFNWKNGDGDIFEVADHIADRWHMIQTLTGDSTDGYPGCPGIGPKKAEAILESAWVSSQGGDFFSMAKAWPLVVEAYRKANLREETALTMARVARILRAEDYDFTQKRPILWMPPV